MILHVTTEALPCRAYQASTYLPEDLVQIHCEDRFFCIRPVGFSIRFSQTRANLTLDEPVCVHGKIQVNKRTLFGCVPVDLSICDQSSVNKQIA